MDICFFKALPEPQADVQWPITSDNDQPVPFVLVALERTKDPDANNHTGFDYFGAYGNNEAINEWAVNQPVETITKSDLPKPITFYPTPFSEA